MFIGHALDIDSISFLQVGNWSRCLTDLFGIDAEDSGQNDEGSFGDDQRKGGNQPEHFHLLNALSDLLMLPKDMLMDRTIRMEVQLLVLLNMRRGQ